MNDKQVQLIVERLLQRVQKSNELFLTNIGSNLKKIKKLKPSQARQLIQILKYGGNYDDIVKKMSKYTNLNVKDIDKIFSSFAKKDLNFNKQFYEYRNIPFTEYEKNMPLKRQTEALTNLVKNEVNNFSRTNVLGYTIKDDKGNEIFKGLREVYNELLDTAFLNVGQGKETFDSAVRDILKDIGQSGLKTINYESGKSMRLDSAITMHLRGRLTELHNENQKLIGDEYGADGVEISVHFNPAPDHEEAQGRQFRLDQYELLQSEGVAKDINGKEIDLHRELKDGSLTESFRPIGEFNCYHYEFRIVVGVNKPEYNEEQLKKIIEDNKKGFEYKGKHYTNYEGEQVQRRLEAAIREQKDIQILGRESGDMELVHDVDSKIKALTSEYKEFSNASGLGTKMDRLRVKGYRSSIRQGNSKPDVAADSKYNAIVINNKGDLLEKWNEIYKNDNIKVRRILNADPKLIDKQITQVDGLLNKYDFVKEAINNDYETNALTFEVAPPEIIGQGNYARYFSHYIEFNEKYFKGEDLLVNEVKKKINDNWWQRIDDINYSKYPVTHEYGHLLEFKMIDKIEHNSGKLGSLSFKEYQAADNLIKQEIFKNVKDAEKYISDYGKYRPDFEWFAETFTQMELGKETPLTKELKKYIEEFTEGNYEYFR